MTDKFEEQYFDVLQNIEFAIVSVYRDHPELADSNVDRVLEGLMLTYKADANQRSVPALKLNELEQLVYASVRGMCEFRLGRSDVTNEDRDTGLLGQEPKTLEEIIACLKRIRVSVKRWTVSGGRQGYLTFVSKFIG